MIVYNRMSTTSRSASSRAFGVGRTLNPMMMAVEVLERHARGALNVFFTLALLSQGGDLPRFFLVGHHLEEIARLGHPGEADDLYRRRRTGVLDLLPAVVEEGANPPVVHADDEGVAAAHR